LTEFRLSHILNATGTAASGGCIPREVDDMLTRLKPKRFSDEIAEQILGLIKNGRLKPGDALPSEREMVKSLGVSHPPLREGLKMLEALGFIDIQPRRKIKVKSIAGTALHDPLAQAIGDDLAMVLQLLEVRKILESWAASRASRLASDEDIGRLKEAYRQLEADFKKDKLGVDADSRFHLAVYQAAKNTVLSHIISTLFDLLWQGQKLIRETLYTEKESKQMMLNQHHEILQAIIERNPRKARSAILSHLKFAERKIVELSEGK
jgi:GntR family transcriptional repressor for pyruvate dehydrogenase complex